ncbi:RNA-binding S4 domain-containing protein [Algiphilus sp.]|uniref:RNA-binding S4 domain-containing protein n=1 Tax=Algiphilus sp. TaxID=1872431 RepID=UPI003B515A75
MNEESAGVRLDKWLWAARFFRTRSLARTAIEAGHVRYDDQRPKVSKNVQVGAQLRIRRGQEDFEVTVVALSDQRRGAPEAQRLYQEHADSIERREQARLERRANRMPQPEGRPDRRDRRALRRFKTGD